LFFQVLSFGEDLGEAFPVSRTASGEIRQNNGGLVWLQGESKFCRSGGQVGAQRMRETFAYLVLPDLQGKGKCGKEAFLLT
jgi:hypothetical protein